MSTSPYSQDLREKVASYLKTGKTQEEASKVFGLHRNTINRWYGRYKKEGICSARPRLGRKRTFEYSQVKDFVKNHPDATLEMISIKFNISRWHSSRILKILGFSYKKKTSPTWNQVNKNKTNTLKT